MTRQVVGRARIHCPPGTYTHFVYFQHPIPAAACGVAKMAHPLVFTDAATVLDVDPIVNSDLAFATMGRRASLMSPLVTENGHPQCSRAQCDNPLVPGTKKVRIEVRQGDVATILIAWAAWWHRNVRSIEPRDGHRNWWG